MPSDAILTKDSHQPEVHLDDAGNEPAMPADTDDFPDVSMDRPLELLLAKNFDMLRPWRN